MFNFSDHERELGFSLVLDMRGSTWLSAKPMLKALQVCSIPSFILIYFANDGWKKKLMFRIIVGFANVHISYILWLSLDHKLQALVVQRLDNVIYQINHWVLSVNNQTTLSARWGYPPFKLSWEPRALFRPKKPFLVNWY